MTELNEQNRIMITLIKITQFFKYILVRFITVSVIALLVYRLFFKLNDFATTVKIISFPLVALISILIFRESIEEKIFHLKALKSRDLEMTFNPSLKQEREALATEEIAQFKDSIRDSSLSEEDVEKIMTMSAAWGYDMAQLGFKGKPVPQIEWKNSSPIIKFGKSEIPKSLNRDDKNLIISAIIETQEEIDGLGAFQRITLSSLVPTRETVLAKKLDRLYIQLRQVDPNSSFLPEKYRT